MNIVSPKLDYLLGSSVPTLSLSEAERGVNHDCSLSETATTRLSNKFWAVSFYSFNRLKNKLKK